MRLFFYFIITLIISPCALATSHSIHVLAKAGNIYYMGDDKQTIQLTHSGMDHAPVLSPNKKSVVFIRTSKDTILARCGAFADTHSPYGEQIWSVDLKNKTPHLLVNHHFSCNKPTDMIVDPRDLKFSPDNKTLYFLTSAWVTSGALHVININGSKPRYLQPANSFDVIKHGKYKGKLVIQQHQYASGGGSYEGCWLYTSEGKKVRRLSENRCDNI